MPLLSPLGQAGNQGSSNLGSIYGGAQRVPIDDPSHPDYDPTSDQNFEDVDLNEVTDPGPGPTVTETEAEQLGRLNTAQHTLQNATNMNQDAIDTLNMLLRGLRGGAQAVWVAVILAGNWTYSSLMSGMQSGRIPAGWNFNPISGEWVHGAVPVWNPIWGQYQFPPGYNPATGVADDPLGPPGNQEPTPPPPGDPVRPGPVYHPGPPGGGRPPKIPVVDWTQTPGSQGAPFCPATTDTVSLSLLALLGAVTALVSGVTAKLAHSHCHVEIDDGGSDELQHSPPKGEEQ